MWIFPSSYRLLRISVGKGEKVEPVEIRIGDLCSDLYIPSERKASGVALFVHGGGFSGGSRKQFAAIASLLAERFGILSLSSDYHLAPYSHFPVQVSDVLSSCRWLCRSSYGIGPDDIFIVGGSPGACIAAVAMMMDRSKIEAMAENPSDRPSKAILLNGIYDLGRFYDENPCERANVDGYVGGSSPERRLQASPSSYQAGGLDVLLLHGTEDRIVTPAQCLAFSQLLQTAGSRCSIRWFPGEGHAWFNSSDKAEEVASVIGEHIKSYSKEGSL